MAAFFFGLMAGPADPFRTVAGAVPANGLGPNVLLQDNALVAFHPPILYLGFVGFTIPFAFAIASLITGRIGEGWQLATRRWTLFAWAFLTVGIVLGAWWSYQVLGWGGFWAWDPVENASFLPWLCATAYLHSVLVQERRGLLRVWNLSLVIATFSLTILGTFLTRSGVIESVHAFSDSDIGPLLLGFFGAVMATGVGLIAWRGDRLRSPGGIDSHGQPGGRVPGEQPPLRRRLPSWSCSERCSLCSTRRFADQQVTVGAPYFNAMTAAHRPGPALPHVGRPRTAVAQDDRRDAARPAHGARPGSAPSSSWGASQVVCAASGRSSPSGWAASRRRPTSGSSCFRLGVRIAAARVRGGDWWGGPTAGWWCTSAWW